MRLDLPMNVEPRARSRPRAGGKGYFLPGREVFNREMWALLPSEARRAAIAEPVTVRMAFWRRQARRRRLDGDNCEKAVLDGLVACGVLAGDHLEIVRRTEVEFVEVGAKVAPRILIEIEPYQPGTWWAG